MILIYSMVGVSLVVLTGWSGNVSLGQWAIVGVGALVTAKLATQDPPLDFFIILVIAGLCGAAVSLVIGLPALRIRGLFLGATTLAFALAAYNWIFQWEILPTDDPILRPYIFGVFDTTSEKAFYYVSFAGVALRPVDRDATFAGRDGDATSSPIRDNEAQAAALGMRLTTLRFGAFAISGSWRRSPARSTRTTSRRSVRTGSIRGRRSSCSRWSSSAAWGRSPERCSGLCTCGASSTSCLLSSSSSRRGSACLILLLVFPGGLGQIFYSMRDRFLREIAARKGI